MRVVALALRAGAVVAILVVLGSVLVDGGPRPVVVAAPAVAASPAASGAQQPAARVVQRRGPSGIVTIAATGDIVLGSAPNLPRDGGRSFFSSVQADLAGDVVLGNLAGTLSVGGSPRCSLGRTSCVAFQTPPAYAARLGQAGFTMMNLANDHAYDFRASGQQQTIAALDRAGVGHTGRPGQIAYQKVGAVTVAVVGFAPYPWAASLTDLPGARRLVAKAAATADLVIVAMHAGSERAPRAGGGDPARFAHAAVDAGADLVVGYGPTTLRGMEWRKGRLIAYSLGTFAGNALRSPDGPESVSGILRITLRRDGTFESGLLVPTRLVGTGVPALDPAETAHGIVRQLSQEGFGARGVRVAPTGLLSRG